MKLPSTFLLLLLLLFAAACKSTGDQGEAPADAAAVEEQSDPGNLLTDEDRGTPVPLEAPVSLTYRFKVGDVFGYVFSSVQQVDLFQDSAAEKNHQEIRHWYRFEVLVAGENGGGRLRVICDRVTFNGAYRSKAGSNEISYDSDAENSYDIEKRFAEHNAPVDAPFEITVESDGRISAVDKLDGVVKNYLRDDYKTTRQGDIESVKSAIADAKLKAVLQLAFQKLADKPVAKDSTWRIVRQDKLGYLGKEDAAEYTVRDVVSSPKGRVAHIGVRISSRYMGDKTFDTGQGMATMDTFDVTGRGLTVFNMLHGRVQRRNLRTDVHVRMYVEPPEELKELAPEQAKNFWWTQKAFIEDSIEPYTHPSQDN